MDNFDQNRSSQDLIKHIQDIDSQNANILEIERSVFRALKHNNSNLEAIAPLADPINLDDLVGNNFKLSSDHVISGSNRLETIYSNISETNNNLKAELEATEKLLSEAVDSYQSITAVPFDESAKFYWVSDTFNNTTFIDKNNTTALVDTDYGVATLSPVSLNIISDYSVTFDPNSNGIPGANLIVINSQLNGSDKEPTVTLDTSDSRNFAKVFDNDTTTWFEYERNAISPNQKVAMFGRSFVFSDSVATTKNVKEITSNFDWKAKLEWPDGSTQEVDLADFTDTPSNVNLSFVLNFTIPQELSAIKLIPFTRDDSPIYIDKVLATLDDNSTILIAENVILGSDKVVTVLQQQIIKRTGSASVGSVYFIPTNRKIKSINVSLRGEPVLQAKGLAHPYKEQVTQERSVRGGLFWKSVDKWIKYQRFPVNEKPPPLKFENKQSSIVGAIGGILKTGIAVTDVYNNVNQTNILTKGQTPSPVQVFGSAAPILGKAASWLGKAMPYIGAAFLLNDLVGGIGSYSHDSTVLTDVRDPNKVDFDIFKGWRAAVGLKDVTVMKMQYDSTGIIQSVKREFTVPVKSVGLFVTEDVPDEWGQDTWITYFISKDGAKWELINKLGSNGENLYTFDSPTSSVYFKAIIKGNPKDIYHTASLKNYALQGL